MIMRACTADGWVAAQALPLVWVLRGALGRVRFETLRGAVARLGSGRVRPSDVSGAARARSIDAVARGVERASRHVDGATCLVRALAVQAMLGVRGVRSEIKFGVGRDAGGAFRAHAWVECDGRVVIGGGEELNGLAPLPAWPG